MSLAAQDWDRNVSDLVVWSRFRLPNQYPVDGTKLSQVLVTD